MSGSDNYSEWCSVSCHSKKNISCIFFCRRKSPHAGQGFIWKFNFRVVFSCCMQVIPGSRDSFMQTLFTHKISVSLHVLYCFLDASSRHQSSLIETEVLDIGGRKGTLEMQSGNNEWGEVGWTEQLAHASQIIGHAWDEEVCREWRKKNSGIGAVVLQLLFELHQWVPFHADDKSWGGSIVCYVLQYPSWWHTMHMNINFKQDGRQKKGAMSATVPATVWWHCPCEAMDAIETYSLNCLKLKYCSSFYSDLSPFIDATSKHYETFSCKTSTTTFRACFIYLCRSVLLHLWVRIHKQSNGP